MPKSSILFVLVTELKSARNIISQMHFFQLATDPSFSGFTDLTFTHNRTFPLLIIVHHLVNSKYIQVHN